MKIIDTISLAELSKMAENMYGNLIKGVVDATIRDRIIALIKQKVTA